MTSYKTKQYEIFNEAICNFLSISSNLFAQKSDPVLFSVAGNPVKVSEFDYIYNKNNGKDANYSRQSLEDYLNLYTGLNLKSKLQET